MNAQIKKLLLYFLFIINIGIIFFFWWQTSSFTLSTSSSEIFISLGRISGLLLAFFVLMQFMIMGRARWIEEVFGLDKLSKLHHYNGYFITIFLLTHPLLLILGYSGFTHLSFQDQLIDFLLNYPDVNQAFIAMLIFLFIIGISIYIVRKRLKYEVWYFIHLLTYLSVALAWGHQLEIGQDFAQEPFKLYWYALYFFVFANLLIFRVIRPLYLFYVHQFTIVKVEKETNSATSLYITGNDIQSFSIKPGQFMKIRILNKKLWWQDHPFSFSMIPNNNLLRVTIKNSGDYTSQISTVTPGTKVIIDGPYGVFTLDKSRSKKLLFIAGGVGITPIRSLLEQAVKEKYDCTLLYNSKSAEDIILKEEIDKISKAFNIPVFYILSQSTSKRFETGHIDSEKIKRLVKDVRERDIYLCGPPTMMNSVINELLLLGVKKSRIHFERFAL